MSLRGLVNAINLDCKVREITLRPRARDTGNVCNCTMPRLYEWLNEGRTAELVYSVYDIISWRRFYTEQGQTLFSTTADPFSLCKPNILTLRWVKRDNLSCSSADAVRQSYACEGG
jgi:hypothetical protein